MSISFRCRCGKEYQVRDELAGRKASCKKCGKQITIPVAVLTSTPAEDDLFGDSLIGGYSSEIGFVNSCPSCLAELPFGQADCPQCGKPVAKMQTKLPSYTPAPVPQKRANTKTRQPTIDWGLLSSLLLRVLPFLGIAIVLLVFGIGAWRTFDVDGSKAAERQAERQKAAVESVAQMSEDVKHQIRADARIVRTLEETGMRNAQGDAMREVHFHAAMNLEWGKFRKKHGISREELDLILRQRRVESFADVSRKNHGN